jgi:DMSO/TMAO reductase YedYZ heme-binding membrane subunit
MRTPRFVTTLVVLSVLAYAIVRYVVVGTVPPAQLPVFILNKALAVASVVLIAAALAIGPLVRMRLVRAAWMTDRKALGIHGFVLGALHAVLTIATLSPASYGKLYTQTATLTFEGGLAVLGGVLALGALIIPAITSATLVRKSMTPEQWRGAQRLGIVALGLGLAHVVALGWRSWVSPSGWPGALPPLTTIAAVAAALAFAIRGVARLHRAASRCEVAASSGTFSIGGLQSVRRTSRG